MSILKPERKQKRKTKRPYIDDPIYMDSSPYRINDLCGLKITTQNEEEQKEYEKFKEAINEIMIGFRDSANNRFDFNTTIHSVLYDTTYLVFNMYNKNGQYNKIQDFQYNWGIYISENNRFVDTVSFHAAGELINKCAYSIKTNFERFIEGKYFCPQKIRDVCLNKYIQGRQDIKEKEQDKKLTGIAEEIQIKHGDNQKDWFVRD